MPLRRVAFAAVAVEGSMIWTKGAMARALVQIVRRGYPLFIDPSRTFFLMVSTCTFRLCGGEFEETMLDLL